MKSRSRALFEAIMPRLSYKARHRVVSLYESDIFGVGGPEHQLSRVEQDTW